MGKRCRTVSSMDCRVLVSATLPGLNGMHERQAIRRLHNAQDKLAGDAAALLVHSERPNVILDRAFTMDAHCGQVIEDNSQITIDQGPYLARQGTLYHLAIVHERIHGAQQVLVRHAIRHCGNGHSFQSSADSPTCCRVRTGG